MLEFEKLNLSEATNVMSQVVKTILILWTFFCFITAIAHKPVCNTAQLGITFMNCRPQKKVQSQIWISGYPRGSHTLFKIFLWRLGNSWKKQYQLADYIRSRFDSDQKWTEFSRQKTMNLFWINQKIDLIWINVQKLSMFFHPFDIHGK